MHYVFATQVIIYRFVIPYQDWNLPLTQNFLIGLFSLQPDVYFFQGCRGLSKPGGEIAPMIDLDILSTYGTLGFFNQCPPFLIEI